MIPGLHRRMRIVVFEGLDGAGKTTLFREFEKNYDHYQACFDRWPPISNYVYDRFFNRHLENLERDTWLEALSLKAAWSFGLIIVFVDTSPLVCWERRRLEEAYSVQDYECQRGLYANIIGALSNHGVPVIRVTGEARPQDNAQKVERFLRLLDREEERDG